MRSFYENNKQILDEFGRLVSTIAFDSQYGSLRQVLTGEAHKFKRLKRIVDIFKKLNLEEKNLTKISLWSIERYSI